ncbi:hypothetical protein N430_03584 [Pseudomonas sp. CC120222-01a]|nr:hypothetical protein N430_03584 [Pseudomonas sp. CC120222-01a]
MAATQPLLYFKGHYCNLAAHEGALPDIYASPPNAW